VGRARSARGSRSAPAAGPGCARGRPARCGRLPRGLPVRGARWCRGCRWPRSGPGSISRAIFGRWLGSPRHFTVSLAVFRCNFHVICCFFPQFRFPRRSPSPGGRAPPPASCLRLGSCRRARSRPRRACECPLPAERVSAIDKPCLPAGSQRSPAS